MTTQLLLAETIVLLLAASTFLVGTIRVQRRDRE